MLIYIGNTFDNVEPDNTASIKAKADVVWIIRNSEINGITRKKFYNTAPSSDKFTKLTKYFKAYLEIVEMCKKDNCLLLFQTGALNPTVIDFFSQVLPRRIKKALIVHDLNHLRYDDESLLKKEKRLLFHFDYIIVHTPAMAEYVKSTMSIKANLIILECFDYIVNNFNTVSNIEIGKTGKSKLKIGFAGNLSYKKSSFIYKLIDSPNGFENIIFYLYGPNFEIRGGLPPFIVYRGSVDPLKLPEVIRKEVDFGLIWDGSSISSLEGRLGKYLKYNAPHKFSLYMVSGVPVITHKDAAIAGFIKRHNIGLLVDSINNIAETAATLSVITYSNMKKNVWEIAKKVSSGFYTIKAIETVVNGILMTL